MTLPVFLVSELAVGEAAVPLSDVEAGQIGSFGGSEARHAHAAMRLSVGDQLELCDGEGVRLLARVAEASNDVFTVKAIVKEVEDPSPVRLTLVQGLAKGGRDEMAVEASTELGVDRIVPWQAVRSVSRWSGAKAQKNEQKWRNLVWAATKQSRRARLPVVDGVVTSGQLAEEIAALTAGGGLALVCDEEAAEPLAHAVFNWIPVPGVAGALSGEVLVVVGPEGGVSPEEKEAFVQAGASPVLLGPHVLRTSTAGPAALTLLDYLLGRWDHPPRGPEVMAE